MTYPTQHISVSVNRAFEDVYRFISNPQNITKWAEGLASSTLVQSGDSWIAESPMGKVSIKFSSDNSDGIVDHWVTLPSGEVNYNPLRVVKNNKGSEIIFTLFHLPRMTEDDFIKDASLIENDLLALKNLLEQN